MAKRMRLENRTAAITGAASGIGRAVALSLARRHCNLALADINGMGLNQTADLVAPNRISVTCHMLDVSDAQAVASFPQTVLAMHPGVDILVNNAGVALGGSFEQISPDDFEWLFGINFWGTVRMTRAFLPVLHNSDDARIVNLSSVFGLIGAPGQTAYVASKFAVRGFSEALRQELTGSHIAVTVVHPGGVATNILDNARPPAGTSASEQASIRAQWQKILTLPPEAAGEIIVRGIERRQDRVLVGSDAMRVELITSLAPVSYPEVLKRLMN